MVVEKGSSAVPTVLIVDDSDYSRVLLEQYMLRLGHLALVARNGKEAWELIQNHPINVIITDWIMPEMDGIELCRRIRSAEFKRYIYIILLTIKDGKNDMIEGLEAGADNFIVKPCSISELRVKLITGQRILDYEKCLDERYRELDRAHDLISQGLKSAARFHHTLLPSESVMLQNVNFQSLSAVCDIATGDMFNFFQLDEDRLVFYMLDVAGHGVPASMLSFTLSHIISPGPGISKSPGQGMFDLGNPPELAARLNEKFQARNEDWLSFTLLYGIVELRQQKIRFTQAGHPPPIYMPHDGPTKTVGEGGFPVGFFEGVNYEEYVIDFRPGDRLLVYSDGVTECRNPDKNVYSQDRLFGKVEQDRNLSLRDCVSRIRADLVSWKGTEQFEDDWSILGLEFGKET